MKPDKLGMTITVIVLWWALALFIPLLQNLEEPIEQNPLARPSNMDFDNCKTTVLKANMPYTIQIFHEKTINTEILELHEDPDSIIVYRYTDHTVEFFTNYTDNRFIQVSFDYANTSTLEHEVLFWYISDLQEIREISKNNGTSWCRIFEVTK